VPLRRLNGALEAYARAAQQVAQQALVPFLDLRSLFEQHQGWQQQLLQEDGVHLTAAGNEAVFKALMLLVEQQVPSIR
jgi:lysophospholipase L1-like esterase